MINRLTKRYGSSYITRFLKQLERSVGTFLICCLCANFIFDGGCVQEVYVELRRKKGRGILPEVIGVAVAHSRDKKIVDLHNEIR